jgi:zinc transport system substrate-binding protein
MELLAFCDIFWRESVKFRLALLSCFIAACCVPGLGVAAGLDLPGEGAARGKTMLLATTFPIFQITRNLLAELSDAEVSVELLFPVDVGCPHDYALTPHDLTRMQTCDIVVMNGLGLDDFLLETFRRVNPKARIIDSAAGLPDLLVSSSASGGDPHEGCDGHDHGHAHAHGSEVNPHLFASPRRVAALARAIARELGARLPTEHSQRVARSAQAFIERMELLAAECSRIGAELANARIITQHSAFDYLAADMGLDVVGVVMAEPGQELGAADLIDLVRTAREKQAGAVFTEPQFSPLAAQTLAREVGIPCALLDPCATGPADAPLDYFETVMRRNLEVLQATLGVRK